MINSGKGHNRIGKSENGNLKEDNIKQKNKRQIIIQDRKPFKKGKAEKEHLDKDNYGQ